MENKLNYVQQFYYPTSPYETYENLIRNAGRGDTVASMAVHPPEKKKKNFYKCPVWIVMSPSVKFCL